MTSSRGEPGTVGKAARAAGEGHALGWAAAARRGRQARRRSGAGPGDRAVRRGAGAERRRHRDGRRGRAAAREPRSTSATRRSGCSCRSRCSSGRCSRSRSGCSSTATSGCRSCAPASSCGASPRCSARSPAATASLLLTRLLLGAVAATAGPAIASLTGDYFPARERGQIYAYILGGEIAGTAVGLHRLGQRGEPDRLAGGVRAAGHPGLLPRPGAVADRPRAAAGRPESPRAGSGRSARGGRAGCARARIGSGSSGGEGAPAEDDLARQAAEKSGVEPNPDRWS